jgi:TIR domain-containing protein
MADVFISYAREDEPKARQLAEALTSRGWEVWWDRHITPGELFSKVIQRELEEAPSVVVLWSRGSIASEYVQDEATVAKERGALVPALIDDVQPPLGFRQRQVVNLTAWTGDVGDREYLSLTDAIGRRVSPRVSPGARPDKPPVPIPLERPDTSPHVQDPLARAVAAIRGRPARSMLLAAAVIVVTLAVAWWSLDGPPRHTYRQLDVTVKLGDWMNVRALYGTAAFYRKIHPQVVTGQFFSEEEMWSSPPQRPNVVLLSERFWKEELNSDRSILERSVFLNSYGYRIRGVVSLPRSWNSVDILFPHKASQAPDF